MRILYYRRLKTAYGAVREKKFEITATKWAVY
jgi:hypothetical protein